MPQNQPNNIKNHTQKNTQQYAKNTAKHALSNKLSILFGKFANYPFPRFFQAIVNSVYVRIFHIDLSDFAPAHTYPTLNALFTRSLAKSRSFDTDPKTLISPSDSVIMEQGKIFVEDSALKALQIKGMSYAIDEFLGESATNLTALDSAKSLSFINLYLSPSDYHHYHAPCDMKILEVRYFGGVLLPVNPPSLRKNQNLFIQNERVVVVAEDLRGQRLYYVAVGALNVGKMIFHFEPKIQTNAQPNAKEIYHYNPPIEVKKGDELGTFMMGSTIVLIAQGLFLQSQTGTKVKQGDIIASLES
ncbi:phosphatidylserine decarboxylase [Helicobacter sp. T3_23-1059]